MLLPNDMFCIELQPEALCAQSLLPGSLELNPQEKHAVLLGILRALTLMVSGFLGRSQNVCQYVLLLQTLPRSELISLRSSHRHLGEDLN